MINKMLSLEFKPVKGGFVHPSKCFAARFQPRHPNEFRPQELMKDVEATNGVITTDAIVWQPTTPDGKCNVNDPIWDELHDNYQNVPVVIPKEDRPTSYILVRGHRRHHCVSDINARQNDFPHAMWENAQKFPVKQVFCSEEEAEELAVDQGESEGLSPSNLLAIEWRMFRKGYTWEQIAYKHAKMLYTAFRSKDIYDKIVSDPDLRDGKDRQDVIVKGLRNTVYAWHEAAFDIGLMDQLILTTKFSGRSPRLNAADPDFPKWVIDAKRTTIVELHKLYVELMKKTEWTPVRRLEITETKEKEEKGVRCVACPSLTDDLTGKFFVVEGGHPRYQEELLKLMIAKVSPESVEPKVKRPSEKDATKIESSIASGLGRSTAASLNRGEKDPVKGTYIDDEEAVKDRTAWEEWGLTKESIQAVCSDFLNRKGVQPLVQTLLKALVAEKAPKASGQKVETALATLNEALKPKATKKAAKV